MILKIPIPFSFLKTVESHGWCRLPPFYLDSKRQILTRVERLDGGKIVELEMEESRAGIQID
ncbi:MAG: Fe-S cluster assembly protein HesB, partial [Candidatus Methanofastidiosia archaeon]